MVRFTEQDVRRDCGPGAFEAGRRYYSQARVVSFARSDDMIRSSVKGSEKQPYKQTIVLSQDGAMTDIFGSCSCPVGQNCKHVVASLLHGLMVASAGGPAAVLDAEAQLARLMGASLAPPVRHQPQSPQRSMPPRPAESELPAGILAWLDDLGRAATSSGEDYPEGIQQRLIYVVRPIAQGHKLPMLGIQPISAKLKKNGGWAAGSRPYQVTNPHQPAPKHLRPSDCRILRELTVLPVEHSTKTYQLGDDSGPYLLARILETGRARWLDLEGPVLRMGSSRPGRISWQPIEDSLLVPRLEIEGGGEALAATPPVYVDPVAGLVGPVETGRPPRIAAALFRAPAVAAAVIPALNTRLSQREPDLAALAPPVPERERRSGIVPVPVLRLFTAPFPVERPLTYDRYAYGYEQFREPIAIARLAFRYGTIATALGEQKPTVTRFQDGRLIELERRPASEAAAVRLLLDNGFEPASDIRRDTPAANVRDFLPEGDDLAWLEVMYRVVPKLKAEGWDVDVAPDFPIRLLRADGDFSAEVSEGSGIDWLELHLGVTVDGERVDLVEPIVAMISSPGFTMEALERLAEDDGDPVFVPLPNGRVLAVPLGRLRPIVSAIRDLAFGSQSGNGRLRLSRHDAARLAEFEAATAGAALAWHGGEAIRDLGRKLTAQGGIPPVAPPSNFRAVLRPYQAEGVSWLSLLRDVGLGGILADDMGLGKTVQALAFLAIEKAAGRLDRPALVVAPTSLMGNWRREAERFAPDLRVLTLHGLARKALFDRIPDHDLVLTTYPLVARDRATLAARNWHVLLLDEAQTIKNPDATTTRLILSLDARHRFCLTGTPLENNLGELWSLFSFACPGLLGDRKHFTTAWRSPIEKAGDAERGRMLARRIRPFMIRRTKEEVARDLPPKTEMVERIELATGQRDVYESIRLSMHERIRTAVAEKGWARSRIIVLDALLKLRQACCDPRLLKLKSKSAAAGSAKLERLEEMLEELLAEGRRVIVFSQFASMLDLIRPRLDAAGVSYALLTGSTRDRPAAVAAFDSGAAKVFLVSLKAGGVGLNLVSADTVVLYDPWWNPAVEEQAIDRAHRIGQTKPVFVHKLVAADTIEEKMEMLKEKKAALAASLFDHDGEPTLAMTEADIDMLLAS